MPKALERHRTTFYRPCDRRGGHSASCSFEQAGNGGRAVSSAVEHYVDIVGVTGSIPVPPTIEAAGKPAERQPWATAPAILGEDPMKVRNSLRSLKNRHRDCRVVRRKGRIYVINKTQRRFKARQG